MEKRERKAGHNDPGSTKAQADRCRCAHRWVRVMCTQPHTAARLPPNKRQRTKGKGGVGALGQMRLMIYVPHQEEGRREEKKKNMQDYVEIRNMKLTFYCCVWMVPGLGIVSSDAEIELVLHRCCCVKESSLCVGGVVTHDARLLVYPRSGAEGWDGWMDGVSRVDPGGGGGVKSEIQTTCETERRAGLHPSPNPQRNAQIFFHNILFIITGGVETLQRKTNGPSQLMGNL